MNAFVQVGLGKQRSLQVEPGYPHALANGYKLPSLPTGQLEDSLDIVAVGVYDCVVPSGHSTAESSTVTRGESGRRF